ncbi:MULTISPECIES: hypothetical protein [Flavobacterium]|uniref:hypothetical protein n=1 Tax=Flavobacterium TaxID=237 RepID=UPI0021141A8D|nr:MULTISPECIES: hypothetical protein [Flavobacterium]UUF12761.1 hypothetical protein NLJ00_16005 [Flavobacterium panici]
MKIEYTDLYGANLTEQEVGLNSIFIKIFKENNRLRKKEYYENNILFNELNYIELGTSHENLLLKNNDLIGIIEIEEIDLNYNKLYCFTYFNRILESKGIEIELNGRTIMSQDLDTQTNTPIYNKTYKYYENLKTNYEFKFEYYTSGELIRVIVSNKTTQFFEEYRVSELNLIPDFEWWDQYSSYYLNAEPAIPELIIEIK